MCNHNTDTGTNDNQLYLCSRISEKQRLVSYAGDSKSRTVLTAIQIPEPYDNQLYLSSHHWEQRRVSYAGDNKCRTVVNHNKNTGTIR